MVVSKTLLRLVGDSRGGVCWIKRIQQEGCTSSLLALSQLRMSKTNKESTCTHHEFGPFAFPMAPSPRLSQMYGHGLVVVGCRRLWSKTKTQKSRGAPLCYLLVVVRVRVRVVEPMSNEST